MDLILIFAISVGLAMDAFAVSVSAGVYEKSEHFRTALKLAVVFGGFQAGMCIIGWFAGREFSSLISQYDHWVAFILLLVIGSKMIYEGLSKKEEERLNLTTPVLLIILGIATSIDSLAVGLSFAILDTDIIFPSIVIGLVTFAFSYSGVYIGDKFGDIIGKGAEVIGGCILILIGVKILAEGLFF